MWRVSALNLTMTEGDYGIQLPVTISGTTFSENDAVKLVIKGKPNGTVIVEKTFANIQNNTVNLEITAADSALLPVGVYAYILDWYQDGAFMCNIIRNAVFKVVDKA